MLIGEELYCNFILLIQIAFKSKDDSKHKTLVSLKGAFLKEEGQMKSANGEHDIFQINLVFPNKVRSFFLINEVR
jgi:hypothetical protein